LQSLQKILPQGPPFNTGAPERAAAARRAFQRRLIPKRSFALLSRRVEAQRFDEVLAEAIRNE